MHSHQIKSCTPLTVGLVKKKTYGNKDLTSKESGDFQSCFPCSQFVYFDIENMTKGGKMLLHLFTIICIFLTSLVDYSMEESSPRLQIYNNDPFVERKDKNIFIDPLKEDKNHFCGPLKEYISSHSFQSLNCGR